MRIVQNTWGWTPRGIWWWLRWGWAWRYTTWGIVAHTWDREERRAKLGPFCWSLGYRPYNQHEEAMKSWAREAARHRPIVKGKT